MMNQTYFLAAASAASEGHYVKHCDTVYRRCWKSWRIVVPFALSIIQSSVCKEQYNNMIFNSLTLSPNTYTTTKKAERAYAHQI